MKKVDFRLLGLLAIGAIFSGLFGFLIAGANNIAFDGHHHVSIGSTKLADPIALLIIQKCIKILLYLLKRT